MSFVGWVFYFALRVQYPVSLPCLYGAVPPRPEYIRRERIEERVQFAVIPRQLAAGLFIFYLQVMKFLLSCFIVIDFKLED